MSSYKGLLNNIVYRLNHPYIIQEGIEEIKKYFPKIEEKKLRELIALDPTYKGGDQLGKYGQWIIRLFYNNIKNMEREADYRELLKKYPNGKNPKTGQPFAPPAKLPEVKEEDLYKIKESLKRYEMLKKKIGKPIDSFKTLAELDSAIGALKDSGVPQNEKALKRYELFQKGFQVGLKPVFEDKDFIVAVPSTLESSVLFGDDTRWCTTSPNGGMYEHYTKTGNLYIILDKRTGELFQFHFESGSYMDEYDYRIDLNEFTEKNPNVCKAIYEYKHKHEKAPVNGNGDIDDSFITNCITKFKECIENPELFKKEIFYEHECKNFKVDGEKLYLQMDFEYIGDVYRETGYYSSRDIIPEKVIIDILDGTYDSDWDSGYSLDEYYSSITYMWDRLKEEYGITQSWDDILELANENEEIRDIIDDDWYDEYGLLSALDDAEKSGYENALHEDVLSQLQDELPMSYKEYPHDGTLLNLCIPLEKIWTVYLVLKAGKETIPEELYSIDYKEYQPKLNINKFPEFNPKNWYETFKEREKDNYFDDDWLKQYRELYYDNEDFCCTYKDYGYNETDDQYLEETFRDAMPRIKKIIDNMK